PHAPGIPASECVDPLPLQLLAAANFVNVVPVPAVDQRVASLQVPRILGDEPIDDARRYHQPDGARGLQLRDEFLRRGRPDGGRLAALVLDAIERLLDHLGVPVQHDDLVSGLRHADDHVLAHPTQTDHSELHGSPFFSFLSWKPWPQATCHGWRVFPDWRFLAREAILRSSLDFGDSADGVLPPTGGRRESR